jgi:hypothetical protein
VNKLLRAALPLVLAAGVVAAVGLSAVVFVRSDQTARVARDAEVISAAGKVEAAAAVLRSNVGITLVLASAEAGGVAVAEDSRSAAIRTQESLGAFRDALNQLAAIPGSGFAPGDDVRLRSLGDTVDRQVMLAMDALTSGAIGQANTHARDGFLPAISQTIALVETVAVRTNQIINAESEQAGRLAQLASLFVAGALPAMAVIAVRRTLKRRSERELLESDLRAARELSEQRQAIMAGLSHEIRTPLTGIFGFSEALYEEALGNRAHPEFVLESAHTIYTEANELYRMVDDLLVSAKSACGSWCATWCPTPSAMPAAPPPSTAAPLTPGATAWWCRTTVPASPPSSARGCSTASSTRARRQPSPAASVLACGWPVPWPTG